MRFDARDGGFVEPDEPDASSPALPAKINPFSPDPNHPHNSAIPSPRGAFAIVTNAGWDAVDADAPLTNGGEADGEVVWS
jgi:hypothetical protein